MAIGIIRQIENEGFSDQTRDMCEDCKQIDWQRIASLKPAWLWAKKNGVTVANLRMRYHQPPARCIVCTLFCDDAIDFSDLVAYKELRAFSFLTIYEGFGGSGMPADIRSRDSIALVAFPASLKSGHAKFLKHLSLAAGYVSCLTSEQQQRQQSMFTAEIIPPSFTTHKALHWLNYCKSHHQRLCGVHPVQVQGLKLINCETFTVVPARSAIPYAALSYVWGSSNTGRCGNNTGTKDRAALPRALPRVVKDAISVVQLLGLRYLWIDKYCIDQDNLVEKHYQIRNMDSIYKGAEFTIIAAAGNDETFGLPGVGNTLRKPQQQLRLGDLSITTTMAHPHHTIMSSRWATRGWTLQEAVLSRRCLVFTEDQMYFECMAMNCFEALPDLLDLLHTKKKDKFRTFVKSGIFGGSDIRRKFHAFDNHQTSHIEAFLRYGSLAKEYTRRELSYAPDSLNAFTRILRQLEVSEYGLLHLWGIAYIPPRRGLKDLCHRFLAQSLCWTHRLDNSNFSLRRAERRPNSPTWAWTGWAGHVEMMENFGEVSYKFYNSTCVPLFSLEFTSGSKVRSETSQHNSQP